MNQTQKLMLGFGAVLVLMAIVLALDPWGQRGPGGSTSTQPRSYSGRISEGPSLRGAPGSAPDAPPGDAEPSDAHPNGDHLLHLSGIVTHASVPVREATVLIANNARLGVPPLDLARTDEDGRFDVRVASRDLLEPSWIRLWAQEPDPSPRSCGPVVRPVAESGRADDVRLELSEGCRVRMRAVTRDREPVPRAHVLVAVSRPGVATRTYTAGADEGGAAEAVLPHGTAKFRCRSPDGPFGPAVVVELPIDRVSYDVGDLIAPSRTIRVPLHVVDGEGRGVAGAWVSTSDHESRFLHEQSPGDLIHVRADEEGRLLLPPMAPDVFPITVVAATRRHLPTAIEVTESMAAEGTPVRLTLPERPGFDIRLQIEGGGDVSELPEPSWVVHGPGVGDPAKMGSEAYSLALRSRAPLVQSHGDGAWSVYVAAEGPCSCQGTLPGGVTIDLTAEARAGRGRPVVRAAVPPGRWVTAHLVNTSRGGPRPASDLIMVRLLGAEGEALVHGRPWAWTPRSPEIELWAPMEACFLRFEGAGSARAPWQPVTIPLGTDGDVTLDLAEGVDRGGTLRVRLGTESDPIEKQGAVVVVAPLGAATAMEWSLLSTNAEGACEVLLPPGSYHVTTAGNPGRIEAEILPRRLTEVWLPPQQAR